MFRPHLRKPRRFLLITALVAIVALVAAGAAFAGVSLSPESQTVNSGDVTSWVGSWWGVSPFDVTFTWGDGTTPFTMNRWNATGDTFKHTFYTCYDEYYAQTLTVTDAANSTSSQSVHTTVLAGNIC